MKAVVLAYHTIGCVGIEALLRHGFTIQAVFTHHDDPQEHVWFRSVASLAASEGIEVYAPEDINHPMWVSRIREMAPDILFSFYYRRMVSPAILEIPPRGCLNLHGSLLPRYRGRCPINWVLVNGEKETGVTLHYMTPRPDDGDIVGQKAFPIAEEDTALSVYEKSEKAAAELLDELLPLLRRGTAPRVPQDHSKASYFGGRRPEDGLIDWKRPAEMVRNLVRAVTRPYPGAFTYIGDRKLYVWRVRVLETAHAVRPGTVLSAEPLRVACGKDALEILEMQPEGSVPMAGSQGARETGLVPGSVLGERPGIHLAAASRPVRVLILGVNGFIGNALVERLLEDDKYEIYGMDLNADNIERLLGRQRFHFV